MPHVSRLAALMWLLDDLYDDACEIDDALHDGSYWAIWHGDANGQFWQKLENRYSGGTERGGEAGAAGSGGGGDE